MISVVEKAPVATWTLLHRLADTAAPELRAIFLQAVAETVNGVVLPQVSAALARGDLAAAEALIPWDSVAVSTLEAALPDTLRSVVNGAATIASNGLARVIPDVEVSVRFDLVNRRAVDWAEARAADLVTQITEETRAAIRAVIVRGQRDGLSPDAQAREIRSLVGLTERDAGAVQNLARQFNADGKSEKFIVRETQRYADRLLARRSENLARTETMMAANEGNRILWGEAKDQGLTDGMERKWLITPDSRLCVACAPMKGRRAPIGGMYEHPSLGKVEGPPLHPQCVPGDTLVTPGGAIAAQSERRFDGDLVIIRTASGKRLACTPNHPIFTRRGWIPARLVYEVGHVVSRCGNEGMRSGDEDHQYVPARIEEIAEALRCASQMATAPMPVAAEDFHGDGLGSQVAVVRTDRLLRNGDDAARGEHISKRDLGRRDVGASAFEGPGLPRQFLDTPDLFARGLMRRCELSLPLCRRHARPFEALGITLSSRRYSLRVQQSPYASPRDAEEIRDSLFRPAVTVEVEGDIREARPRFAAADGFMRSLQESVDRGAGDIESFRDGDGRIAGSVREDHVIGVDRLSFHGLVYNLQTAGGFYLANGIVTHNCRCAESLVEVK